MTEVQDKNREVLAAVRVRRDSLYDAVLTLEGVLATPAGDPPTEWAASVRSVVDSMRGVLEAHVADTEADGGFFDDVRDHSPQLVHAIERLQAEHGPLLEATAALSEQLASVDDDADVEAARDAAVELIQRLLRHRHRGADLVYDAYSVDISGGD